MSKKRNSPSKSTGAADAPSAVGDSPMNVKLLEQMVKLMAANDLNTVDVRDGEKRVILKRGAVVQASAAPAAVYSSHAAPPPPAASTGTSAPAANEDAGFSTITSPMVGTFYSAPSPDAKPFVSVGSTVDEETEVCTIEAMKNFLPIKAQVRGTITKVLVTSGQTVQFGTPLFQVKPE